MSVKKHRSTLVWILIAVVLAAAFTQIKPFSFVVLPGTGYRAYEWTWVVEFQNMLSNIAGQFPDWQTALRDGVNAEWGKQTDENGNLIVVYSGPTITSYDWQTTQYQDRVRATFKAEVHLWFYGYFPNNIPDAIPLASRNGIPDVFDFFIPKAFAIPAIAIVIIAICVVLGIAISGVIIITVINLLNERQRADQAKTWPEWMQFIYYIIQSILGWLQTLGPTAIILIAAAAAVLIFGTGGKKRK